MPKFTKTLFPSGHFYSPIPSIEEITRDQSRIFATPTAELPGIELNINVQLKLIEEFKKYYNELPFGNEKQDGLRYWFKNPAYSFTDAIFLYSMIRHIKPARIIEIGSGYSSCVTLDTNEQFFNSQIECAFIEPYPKLLKSLIKPTDLEQIEIIGTRVQDLAIDWFMTLKEGDILFIDSTHVSKTGSDVNYIIFELLPRLPSGVFIHFHDIFYPFEYPKRWIMEGRAWNECYLLKAFLQFNRSFEIVLFSHYLVLFHQKFLLENLPQCAGNFGANIWLKSL
jgi:hypothetical protein